MDISDFYYYIIVILILVKLILTFIYKQLLNSKNK